MAKLPSVIDTKLHLPRPPFWMIAGLIVLVVVTWIPLAMIALSRVTLSDARPIELFQGMRDQPRYNAQAPSDLFADGRAMRPAVAGTVARGELRESDHFYRGYEMVRNEENGDWEASYFDTLPPEIDITRELMLRGQERYEVYCYPCHGADGYGQGPIDRRAVQIAARSPERARGTAWVPPSNLHEADGEGQLTFGREQYPDGEMFAAITHGVRNMPAYGSKISVEDRWAIVAYVRALQLSQGVPAEALDEQHRQLLEDE